MEDTILVLGGAGYIGSHTAFLLAQQGYHVIIVDKFIHNQPFEHKWATVIRGDYGDSDILGRIFAAHRISAVMHFAGFISVGESVKKPALYQSFTFSDSSNSASSSSRSSPPTFCSTVVSS